MTSQPLAVLDSVTQNSSGVVEELFVDELLEFLPVVANFCIVGFAILGVIGGAAVFSVYNLNYSPNASETIITLYSITDVIFVVLNCVFVKLDIQNKIMLVFNYGLFGFTLMISLLITNLINFNRYVAICHPIMNRQYFTKKNIRMTLAVFLAISAVQGCLNGSYVYLEDLQLYIDFEFFILLAILVVFTITSKVFIYTRCYFFLKKHDKRLDAYDKSVTQPSVSTARSANQNKSCKNETTIVPPSPEAVRKTSKVLYASKNGNQHNEVNASSSLNICSTLSDSLKSHTTKKTVSLSCSSNLNTPTPPTINKANSRSKHGRTRAVTVAFFCVSFFFIMSVTPLTCTLNYENLIRRGEEKTKNFKVVSLCCRIIFLFHFITNPIIYMVTNASFRKKLFKDLSFIWTKCASLLRLCRKQDSRSQSAYSKARSVPQIQIAPPSASMATTHI